MRAHVCARAHAHVRVCALGARGCVVVVAWMRVRVFHRAYITSHHWVCVRARVCVRVFCVRARACVHVSYLHSSVSRIRQPTQHRSSGSVLHFTPIVNTNIGSRCFLWLYYSLE